MKKHLRWIFGILSTSAIAVLFMIGCFVYWAYEEDRSVSAVHSYVAMYLREKLPDFVVNVRDIHIRVSKDYNVIFVISGSEIKSDNNSTFIKIPRIEIETDIVGTLINMRYKIQNVNIRRPTIYLSDRIHLSKAKIDNTSAENFVIPSEFYKGVQEYVAEYLGILESFIARIDDNVMITDGKVMMNNSEDGIVNIGLQDVSMEKISEAGISIDINGEYLGENFNLFIQFLAAQDRHLFVKLNNFDCRIITDNFFSTEYQKHLVRMDGSVSVNFSKDNKISGIYLGIRNLDYENYHFADSGYNYKIGIKDSKLQIKNNVLVVEDFQMQLENFSLGGSVYINLLDDNISTKLFVERFFLEDLYADLYRYLGVDTQMLRNHVMKGTVNDLEIGLVHKVGNALDFSSFSMRGVIHEGMIATYAQYAPLEDVSGEFVFNDNALNFSMLSGKYGSINLNYGKMDMGFDSNIKANIKVNFNSEIRSLCTEFKCGDYVEQWVDIDSVEGTADTVLNILIDKDRYKEPYFLIKSSVRAFSIYSREGLRVNEGDFQVHIDPKVMKISGDGLLNEKEISLMFKKHMSSDKYQIRLGGEFEVNDLINNRIISVEDELYMNGVMIGDVLIKYDSGILNIRGGFDFNDIAVSIPRLNFDNNESGSLKFSVVHDIQNNNIDVQELSWLGNGIRVVGVGALSDNKIRANVESLKIGNTDCTILYGEDISSREKQVIVNGNSLSLQGIRKIFKTDKRVDNKIENLLLDIGVDKLFLDADVELYDFKGKIKLDNNFIEEFYLDAQGEGSVYIQGGLDKDEVYLISNNAGMVLEGLDISNSIHRGYMTAFFDRRSDDLGKIFAHMVIRNFELSDTPILGQILSLATLPVANITNLLSGKGIPFYRMRISTEYDGKNLIVNEGLAESQPLGIMFSGPINMNTGYFRMAGTVVPAYMLNKAVSKIPLVGKLITGGDGEGFISVNYVAEGTSDSYNVDVDTLSLIAPGALRKILGVLYDNKSDNKHEDSSDATDLMSEEESSEEESVESVESDVNDNNDIQ